MIESYHSPKLEQKSSPIQGVGSFAKEFIREGEVVFIKGGHILTRECMLSHDHIDTYWPIGDGFFLAAKKEAEMDKIKIVVNHSCNPNCGIKGDIKGIALRDIQVGEEITFDYAMLDNEQNEFKCNCKSANCRKIVTGYDWKIEELQKKYKEFFIIYLKEKIAKRNYYRAFYDINEDMHKLRKQVFVLEQQVTYDSEFEGNEDKYIHCCLYNNGVLTAYSRLLVEKGIARIGRVAVLSPNREQGLGREIVIRAEIEGYRLGCKKAELNAQIQAKEFYKKLGYIESGSVYIEAGIEHIKMKKNLIN